MPSRRLHCKNRHGCVECKGRRGKGCLFGLPSGVGVLLFCLWFLIGGSVELVDCVGREILGCERWFYFLNS